MYKNEKTQLSVDQQIVIAERITNTVKEDADSHCPAIINVNSRLNHRPPAIYSVVQEGAVTWKRTELANSWREFLVEHGPYLVMLTISLKNAANDKVALEAICSIIFRLNKKIFGKGFETRGQHLVGFAIAEQHKLCLNRGNLHWHFLIKEFHSAKTDSVVQLLSTLLTKIAPRIRTPITNEEMVSMQGTDARIIDDQGGIAGYLTKQIGNAKLSTDILIGELTARGVAHSAIAPGRKKLVG